MTSPGSLGGMVVHIGADTTQLERQLDVLTIGLESVAAVLRTMQTGLEAARLETES
jgi:topoisomerase IA-like protein